MEGNIRLSNLDMEIILVSLPEYILGHKKEMDTAKDFFAKEFHRKRIRDAESVRDRVQVLYDQ